MGNKGAFITLKGKDMKPNFTTYEAVVSIFFHVVIEYEAWLISFVNFQSHPNVKPMAYANSLLSLMC